MDDIIQVIIELVYGRATPQPFQMPLTEIWDILNRFDHGEVETAVQTLDKNGLLRIVITHDAVALTPPGKVAYERKCAAEICLGEQYLAQKYGPSVVHVIVNDAENDETGGTGFVVADFPGWIATAKHVVENTRIIGINNRKGERICGANPEVRYIADGPDVALIGCPAMEGVVPLRIEWDIAEVHELDRVLALGYAPIARHEPVLVHTIGEISAIAKRQDADRPSLIISRITEPGYSGGPVINHRGYVVGVVEQENQLNRKDGDRSIFRSATPALYLREVGIPR
jgi:Trypsin-like peptidase domain